MVLGGRAWQGFCHDLDHPCWFELGVDPRTFVTRQAELAFNRSMMADSLCQRSFFSYEDKTLNVGINNNNYGLRSAAPRHDFDFIIQAIRKAFVP